LCPPVGGQRRRREWRRRSRKDRYWADGTPVSQFPLQRRQARPQLALAAPFVIHPNQRFALGWHHPAYHLGRREHSREPGRHEKATNGDRQHARHGNNRELRRYPSLPLERHAIVESPYETKPARRSVRDHPPGGQHRPALMSKDKLEAGNFDRHPDQGRQMTEPGWIACRLALRRPPEKTHDPADLPPQKVAAGCVELVEPGDATVRREIAEVIARRHRLGEQPDSFPADAFRQQRNEFAMRLLGSRLRRQRKRMVGEVDAGYQLHADSGHPTNRASDGIICWSATFKNTI